MRSPIRYFGGKGRMTKKIIPLLPETKIYVEAFGGGASILLAKCPAGTEVYNDLDSALYEFFSVLADSKLFEKFYRRVALLPLSRQLYHDCRTSWMEEEDLIERVSKWFVMARQSFGGRFGSGWGFTINHYKRDMSGAVSKWLSIIDLLPEIHARLQRVQIECQDFRKILETYDTPDTCFYLDPPYIQSTRSAGGYKHEMTDDDHRELVEMMLSLKGSSVLSGYNHEIYRPLNEAGWERYEFETACSAAGRTRGTGIQGEGAAMKAAPRTEVVWVKHRRVRQMILFGEYED